VRQADALDERFHLAPWYFATMGLMRAISSGTAGAPESVAGRHELRRPFRLAETCQDRGNGRRRIGQLLRGRFRVDGIERRQTAHAPV
jgi:hypothetical protein